MIDRIVNIIIGLLAGSIVLFSGGPKWACVMTALVVYFTYRASDHLIEQIGKAGAK